MRMNLIVSGVGVAAMLGMTACTTTDPYSSAPRRNNTTSHAAFLRRRETANCFVKRV